ncbi:exported hypothetical protein [uncultured Paludibacter sp.]|nr:exported hypothetical protein [uncultured Paludibacter sp.]
MKNICILSILLFCISLSYSQKYAQVLGFGDQCTINQLYKSNKKNKCRVLIYQPSFETLGFTSILLIKSSNLVVYWKINKSKIIVKGTIENDSIFSYNNFYLTGVRETEYGLKFIPPQDAFNTVIYFDNKYKFYFENEDSPGTYVPDPKYQKYREEWSRIILNELKPIIED